MNTLRGKKGFTLVEIMIVVAIIGLLAAIAIPNLLRARINSNDSAVQGDARAFSTANESFRAGVQPPTFANGMGQLTAPPGGGPPYLDATWVNGVVKHGHTITYLPGGAVGGIISTYALTANMIANQAQRSYCIDQTGVLRVSAPGAAATATNAGCNAAVMTAVV